MEVAEIDISSCCAPFRYIQATKVQSNLNEDEIQAV